jgi:hypothetical protein
VSLSSHLDDPGSPIRAFLRERFPHVPSWVRREASEARRTFAAKGGVLLLPASPPPGQTIPFGTLGTAFDYRLRFEFEVAQRAYVAQAGLRALVRMRVLTRETVEALWQQLDELLHRTQPWAKVLEEEDEARLGRLCVAMTWGEQLVRCGMVPPILEERPKNLAQLLALVPTFWLDDLAGLVRLWREGSRDALPSGAILNPTFDGSAWIGGADADLIVDGCLLEIKTSTKTGWSSEWIRQLLGYVLLDLSDQHGIESVGLYLARQGLLLRWPLPELLWELAGEPVDLETWRGDFAGVVMSVALPFEPLRRSYPGESVSTRKISWPSPD